MSMKPLLSMILAALLLSFTACQEGEEQNNNTEETSTDSSATEEEEDPKEASKTITEPFNDKAMLTDLFIQDMGEAYRFGYKQIGDNFILGGYKRKDTLNFGATLNVNIDLSSCEKKPCKKIDEASRKREMENILYWFKEPQKNSEHFEYTSEEIEVAGKKMSVFYKYHWFEPKEPKDTVKNKTHRYEIYFSNEYNSLRVSAFPYVVKNLSAEEWKTLVDKETLKQHAIKVAEAYLEYY